MNYTDLYSALISFTENTSTEFAAIIPTCVRLAEIRIYREVDLPMFRKTALSNVQPNNYLMAKPDDCVVVRSVGLNLSGNNFTQLLQKDDTFLMDYWPDPTVTGTPRYYADWDAASIAIAPTPATAMAIEMHYTYLPESIVTAQTTWLGTNAYDALFFAAMLEALSFEKAELQEIGSAGAAGAASSNGIWVSKYGEALTRLRQQLSRMRTDEYRAGQIRGY